MEKKGNRVAVIQATDMIVIWMMKAKWPLGGSPYLYNKYISAVFTEFKMIVYHFSNESKLLLHFNFFIFCCEVKNLILTYTKLTFICLTQKSQNVSFEL